MNIFRYFTLGMFIKMLSIKLFILVFIYFTFIQKEILRKVGNPGQQTPFYTAVKSLLERIAPVMIDADAISALVKYNCDVISGLIIVDDGVLTAGAKGLKLLLVNIENFSYCVHVCIWGKGDKIWT